VSNLHDGNVFVSKVLLCNIWLAMRNIRDDEVPTNLAQFSRTRIKVGLQYILLQCKMILELAYKLEMQNDV
jgi:hypothetical protein